MEQIIVTHLGGSTMKLRSKDAGSVIRSAKQTVERLGQDVVDISVESVTKLTFQIGDKITVIGRDYTLNQPARETKVSSEMYKYDLQFEGVQYDLTRANYNVSVDTVSSEIQDVSGDSLTGDLKMFLDVLMANVARVFPGKWVLGTYPETTDTKTLTFSDEDNCLSVLQMLCGEDQYNTEFKIDIDENGVRTLSLGEFGNVFPFTFEHKRSKGLYNLTREKLSTSNIITKLFVYGGSKNINTSKYRATKLCLPTKTKGQSFIQDAAAIAAYGVWEKTKTFDDIYPKMPGRPSGPGIVTSLGVNVYEFIDSAMDFDLNATDVNGNTLYLVPGSSAKVHFNTGNLAGYEFEITAYDHATKRFTIKGFTDENGYSFPNPDNAAFQFAANDDYVLTDIYMPQAYIDAAETALGDKGAEFLAKYSHPQFQYGLDVEKTFLEALVGGDVDQNIFWPGDYIPVLDADFALNRNIRVKGFTRDLLDDYPAYSGLKIADFTASVTLITRIVSDIKGIDSIVKINNLNDPARARRNWKVTQELVTMLETLQAEAALIGNDPAGQYTLSQVVFKANNGGDANSFTASACVIAHTYYPQGSPGTWNVSAGIFGSLTAATPYYLYIKADQSSAGAIFVLSSTKISVEGVAGYYHFPVGILSSVVDGRRSFQTTKGYTLITGGDIKTGRISSTDGQKYFDLDTGEIKGSFKFVSGTDVETAISTAQAAGEDAQAYAETVNATLQAQIDGVVDNWFYAYTPTTSNHPANTWNTPAMKAQHVGDTFTNTQAYVDDITTPDAGKSWRWVYDEAFDTYIWTPIADSDAVKALLAASTAQDTADSKRRNFTGTAPYTPYDVGDLWSAGPSGDLKRCIVARATGAYQAADWELASKYTDDTAAQTAQADATEALGKIDNITSDNVLSAAEKPSQRQAWDIIAAEKAGLEAQATSFGITTQKTTYTNAFMALGNYLNDGEGFTVGMIPGWIADAALAADEVIVGSTYRSTWKAYYDARTALLNAISAKAKTLANAAGSVAAAAQQAAEAAQDAAYGAQTDATSALNSLTSIISDNVLSAAEKPAMRQAWDVAYNEGAGIMTQASTFGVSSVNYEQAFVALCEYLNDDTRWSSGVPLWISDAQLGTNTTIVGAVMRGTWETYYTERQALLNAIALKAKTLADEAKTAANSLDYLKTAMAESTDISGGLLATSILLLKSAGVIKGGISGVNADPVASWFGGTYAQAQADAVKAFKAAMSVGGLDRKDGAGHRAFGNFAWNALGDIFVKGIIEALGGKIGNYTIEAGSLVGRNSAGAEKIRLSDQPLDPLSTLSSGTVNIGEWPALSDTQYIQTDQEGNAAHFELYFDYPLMPFVIPYTTTAQVSAGQFGIEYLSSPASVSSSEEFAMAFVYKDDGSLYWSGPVDTNFSIVGGSYKAKIRISIEIWLNPYGGTTVRYGMDDQGRGIQYTESVARSCFGLDGFFSYWSNALYMYMSQSAGLIYKGAMNIPGVLAAGTINSDGSRDANKKWGAKNNIASITKTTGTYTVPHAVGHENYMVYITPLDTGRTYQVAPYKTNNSFTVVFKVGSTNTDTAFDYVIIGAN